MLNGKDTKGRSDTRKDRNMLSGVQLRHIPDRGIREMKIYHYTDLNGLKGIVESNSLWATNFRFLNDAAELEHGVKALESALVYLEDELGKENTDFILRELKIYQSRSFRDIYNISFCEEPDLLSQWRGYGAYQGVCLEFDRDELDEKLDFTGCEHVGSSVFYTKPGTTLEAKREILSFLKENDFFGKSVDIPHYELVGANELIGKLVPFFKDDGFRDEKEFRIAVQVRRFNERVKFRINPHGLIPYIEIKAGKEHHFDKRLPIKGITVGPCNEPNFIEEGIRFLLSSQGYSNVEVLPSAVPFRA